MQGWCWLPFSLMRIIFYPQPIISTSPKGPRWLVPTGVRSTTKLNPYLPQASLILNIGRNPLVSGLGMLGSFPEESCLTVPSLVSSRTPRLWDLGAHDSLNKISIKQSTLNTSRSEETLQGWRESTSPGGMSVRLANILAAARARLATIVKVYCWCLFIPRTAFVGVSDSLCRSTSTYEPTPVIGLFLYCKGPRGANTAMHKLHSDLKLTDGRPKIVHPDASEPKMPLQDERVPESMRWQYWGSAAP